MINSIFRKMREQLFSLRVGFIVVFLLAVAIGVGAFFAGTFAVSQYIENVYVKEENKKEREDGYLRDLQDFINENKISSDETGKISQWARDNQYVYLLIYKDNKIFFTSDDAEDEDEIENTPEKEETTDAPTEDKEPEADSDSAGDLDSEGEGSDADRDVSAYCGISDRIAGAFRCGASDPGMEKGSGNGRSDCWSNLV